MPPHRIVQEQRFKKIFTRSDFLVCVGTARATRQQSSIIFSFGCTLCCPHSPPLLPACSYIERAKFQDVQFKEVTVKVAAPCSCALAIAVLNISCRMLTTLQDLCSPTPRSTLWYVLSAVFSHLSADAHAPPEQRVLEEQLAALTAKDEDGEMT